MTDKLYKQIADHRYIDRRYLYIHTHVAGLVPTYPNNCFSYDDLVACHMFPKAFVDDYINYGLHNRFLVNATDDRSYCDQPTPYHN